MSGGNILTMPRLGETMEEGRIVGWLVKPGQSFRRGEAILEIETDKTVAEYPALADGTLVETLAAPGDTLAVGAPLARIEVAVANTGLERFPDESIVPNAGAVDAADIAEAAVPAPSEGEGAEPGLPAPGAAGSRVPAEDRLLRATPIARRFAARAGIDIGAVQPSGRRGRIELRDVERHLNGALPDAGREKGGRADASGIAFDRYGRPDATRGRLLVLHGFAGDRTTFSAFGSALGRAGFDVLVPDLPSHGETKHEAAGVEDLAEPFPAFLDGLGFAPDEIVAHSLGAVAAVRLAEGLPDLRGLTLLCPAGLGLAIDGDFVSGMADRPSPGALRHLLRLISAKPVALSDEAVARMAAELGRGRLDGIARDAFGSRGQRVDIVDALARLSQRVAVRVVFGLEDRIVPWTQAAALPSAVAIHLVAGAGHMPHWDQPAAVAALFIGQSGTKE